MSAVLGIDIGTTSTIGVILRPDEEGLCLASRPVTFQAPQPGWAEEDPEEWWANVCAIVPQLLSESGMKADDIAGVGVAGMLPAVVLLDEEGRVLRPSIQQSDGRCGREVEDLLAEVPESDFLARAGNGINQQLVTAKLRWIEKHEPDVFSRIATVCGSYDYINWRLTGRRAVEQNWALEAGFVDVHERRLSADLIALAHIPETAIPPLVASHEVLGQVTAQAAAQTGLKAGTPVVGGAADHIASAFAAGIAGSGDVLLKFGGAADILIATERAVPDPRMYLDYHLVPGLYMPNGCMASGGSALNWFVDHFAAGETAAAAREGVTPHAYLDRLAEEIPPGAGGVQVIPYFLGEKTPIHDPDARGIVTGLSFNHRPAHMWRALLEGFGYAFRHHIEVLNDMGHPTRRFVASDGGARSRLWMQIVADILQQPVQLLTGHPGSCLGAAWMAVIGSGLSQDWTGSRKYIREGEVIRPNAANAQVYQEGYGRFRQTYRAMAAVEPKSRP
ncbi:FGGY-family carbohydrate kinase [Pelagibius sp. CAU 1746]|uniref:FGGY-family carbohydrate kinase n=1 Tax=Pelagibius sp. CAU 1746 TaxID=3140370 RepID=UPI00325BF8BA